MGAIPFPARADVCGDPAAESVTCKKADSDPTMEGVNCTVITQLLPAPRDPGQVFVCEKSAAFVPVSAIPEMVTDTPPMFVSVMDWPALCVFCT